MKAKWNAEKKMTGNGFLLLITIALFAVMYIAGMIIFADKGFAKPQMFLNLFVSNAGLLVTCVWSYNRYDTTEVLIFLLVL